MRRAWEHVKVGPWDPSFHVSTVGPYMTWLPQIDRVTWFSAQRINHSTPAGPRKGSSGREEHEKVGPGACEPASGFDFTYTHWLWLTWTYYIPPRCAISLFREESVRSGILYFLLGYFVFWRGLNCLNALRGHHVSCGTIFSPRISAQSWGIIPFTQKNKKGFDLLMSFVYLLNKFFTHLCSTAFLFKSNGVK